MRHPLLAPMARRRGPVSRTDLNPRAEHESPVAQSRRLMSPRIPGDRSFANDLALALCSERNMRASAANHIPVLTVIIVRPIRIWNRSSAQSGRPSNICAMLSRRATKGHQARARQTRVRRSFAKAWFRQLVSRPSLSTVDFLPTF